MRAYSLKSNIHIKIKGHYDEEQYYCECEALAQRKLTIALGNCSLL